MQWLSGHTRLHKRCKLPGPDTMKSRLIEVSVYQEHLCKNMTDKYGRLSNAMNNMIQEANTEIQGLQDRMSGKLAEHHEVMPLLISQILLSSTTQSKTSTTSCPRLIKRRAKHAARLSSYMLH